MRETYWGEWLWAGAVSVFIIFLLIAVIVIQYRIDSIEDDIAQIHPEATIEARR